MAFPLSSQNGDVHWNGSQVAHARGWTVNPTNEVQEFVTNLTKGKKNRRPGNVDVTGSFTIYSGAAALPCYPGQIATLKLYVTAAAYWTLTKAIILDINPEVDIEGGTLEGFTVNFAFAGADDGVGGSIVAPDGTVLDKTTSGEVAES